MNPRTDGQHLGAVTYMHHRRTAERFSTMDPTAEEPVATESEPGTSEASGPPGSDHRLEPVIPPPPGGGKTTEADASPRGVRIVVTRDGEPVDAAKAVAAVLAGADPRGFQLRASSPGERGLSVPNRPR